MSRRKRRRMHAARLKEGRAIRRMGAPAYYAMAKRRREKADKIRSAEPSMMEQLAAKIEARAVQNPAPYTPERRRRLPDE